MNKKSKESALKLIRAQSLKEIVAILGFIKETDSFFIQSTAIMEVSKDKKEELIKSLSIASFLLKDNKDIISLSKSKNNIAAVANLSKFPVNKEAAIEAAVTRRSGIQSEELRKLLEKALESFNRKKTEHPVNNRVKRNPGESRKNFKERMGG